MNTFGESIVKSVTIEAADTATNNKVRDNFEKYPNNIKGDIACLQDFFPEKLHFLFDPKKHKHNPVIRAFNNFEFTFSKDLSANQQPNKYVKEGVIAAEFKVIVRGSTDLGIRGIKKLENSFGKFARSLGLKKFDEGRAQDEISIFNENSILPIDIPCYHTGGFCIWAGVAYVNNVKKSDVYGHLTLGCSLGIPEDENYLRLYTWVEYRFDNTTKV